MHQLAPSAPHDLAMQMQRLADLVADRVDRRERGHRLLEDDGDAAAADGAHGAAVARQCCDVDRPGPWPARIVEQDLAAGDRAALRQDAHDRLADHRLAGAGFADQRHRAARGTRKETPRTASSRPPAMLKEIFRFSIAADRFIDAAPAADRRRAAHWPMAARLARVVSSISSRGSRAARAARARISSKPSILESMPMRWPREIQPQRHPAVRAVAAQRVVAQAQRLQSNSRHFAWRIRSPADASSSRHCQHHAFASVTVCIR